MIEILHRCFCDECIFSEPCTRGRLTSLAVAACRAANSRIIGLALGWFRIRVRRNILGFGLVVAQVFLVRA